MPNMLELLLNLLCLIIHIVISTSHSLRPIQQTFHLSWHKCFVSQKRKTPYEGILLKKSGCGLWCKIERMTLRNIQTPTILWLPPEKCEEWTHHAKPLKLSSFHFSLGGDSLHLISYLVMDSILTHHNVSYWAVVFNESIKSFFFSGDLD